MKITNELKIIYYFTYDMNIKNRERALYLLLDLILSTNMIYILEYD
jgi:hypothetical protein